MECNTCKSALLFLECELLRTAGKLVLFFSFFTFLFYGVDTDFFVILLEGGEILTGFGEFTFFHTFTDVPMDESSLGVHEIEFVVETSPCLGDGGGVAQHA